MVVQMRRPRLLRVSSVCLAPLSWFGKQTGPGCNWNWRLCWAPKLAAERTIWDSIRTIWGRWDDKKLMWYDDNNYVILCDMRWYDLHRFGIWDAQTYPQIAVPRLRPPGKSRTPRFPRCARAQNCDCHICHAVTWCISSDLRTEDMEKYCIVVRTDSSCIFEATDSRQEIVRIRWRPDDPPAKKAKTSAS